MKPFTVRCSNLDEPIRMWHRGLRLDTDMSRVPPELERGMTSAVKAFFESLLGRLEAMEAKGRQADSRNSSGAPRTEHRPDKLSRSTKWCGLGEIGYFTSGSDGGGSPLASVTRRQSRAIR